MHILVSGVDLIEIYRIQKAVSRYGQRFLKRIYTDQEVTYSQGRAPQLASRFAAKEAVMKALGTGARGLSWKEIEVVRENGMAPSIHLHGRAQARANRMGISQISLSLSHSKSHAVAFVVCQSLSDNTIPLGDQ